MPDENNDALADAARESRHQGEDWEGSKMAKREGLSVTHEGKHCFVLGDELIRYFTEREAAAR